MLDEQTDQLYQLPLEEFTAARNALAKTSGDSAVKKLEKPVLAAWAVNQLYWHERKLYDEVIKTSRQVRTAHQQMLAGTASDVRAAEVFHAEAMRQAKGAIRKFIEAAGNAATDTVMTPVSEMLDALPTTDEPGRFIKPFRRTGFEALHGVTIAAKPVDRGVPKPARTKAEEDTDEASRKREADKQELLMAKERLRFADAATREAEAALERAQRSLERAERTRERVEKELDEAAAAEKAAAKDVSTSESALQKAKAERLRLAKQISA